MVVKHKAADGKYRYVAYADEAKRIEELELI